MTPQRIVAILDEAERDTMSSTSKRSDSPDPGGASSPEESPAPVGPRKATTSAGFELVDWAATVAIGILLWLPVALCDLTGDATLHHLHESYHRTIFLLALGVACGLGVLCGLVGVAVDKIVSRLVWPGGGLFAAAAGTATCAHGIALLQPTIQASQAPGWWALAMSSLGGVVCGAVVWIAVLWISRRFAPRIELLLCGLAGVAWLTTAAVLSPQVAGLAVVGSVVVSAAALLERGSSTGMRWACRGVVVAGAACMIWPLVAAERAAQALWAPTPTAQAEMGPNVVVIVIDTWRPDFLHEGRTPTLDALLEADRPVTMFPAASAAGTSTIPSIKSMLTSLPASHWGYHKLGEEPPRRVWTMASAFRARGYATAGFSANGLIFGEGFQTDQGEFRAYSSRLQFSNSWLLGTLFAHDDYWFTLQWLGDHDLHKTPGQITVDDADRFLARYEEENPFFLYLHIVEPHWPFKNYGHGFHRPGQGAPLSHVDLIRAPAGPQLAKLHGGPEHDEMLSRYEEGIVEADVLMADLLDVLARHGVRDDSMIVILGDHGEELLERGGFSHGHDVFEEQSHVPLVVLWPDDDAYRTMPRRVEEPVSLLDLLPTMTALFELPKVRYAGQSLLPLLRGEDAEPHPITIESAVGGQVRTAYRVGPRKVRLTFSHRVPPAATTSIQVFDLATDPDERSPVPPSPADATLVREAIALYQPRWERWTGKTRDQSPRAETKRPKEDEATESADPDDEALDQLRSLGYVE